MLSPPTVSLIMDALNDHCTVTTHSTWHAVCQPCDRVFGTTFALQDHISSRSHVKRSKAYLSAQRTQACIDGHAATVKNKVEALYPNVCPRCELWFDNHELLVEHYRTSSMHRFCLNCFQVFPSKELLDQHMTELCHFENQILRIPKSKKQNRKKKSTALSVNPPSVNSLAISPVERTPQPELVDGKDFVLLDKSSLLLPASETSIPQEHGHDDETQPALETVSKVKTLNPNFCSRCELRFNNHGLLLEHYRTSSMHRFCLECFQVFPSKELLDEHMRAFRHLRNKVLCIPKSKKKKNRRKKATALVDVNQPPAKSPAVLTTEPTSQTELVAEDDFILVERPSPPLPTTRTQLPVTSIPQTENAEALLHTSLLKCPGCQNDFHLFSTFVFHIETGACSSVPKSRQINREINALAAQLFSNISMI